MQREIALLLFVAAAWMASHGCWYPTTGGMGANFVELYPVAERTCDASVSGEVLGKPVTVHYVSALGEPAARAFLAELEAFQRERDLDYAVLRSGLHTHLGDELFARVEGKEFLRPKELEATWFLLAGAKPSALTWGRPEGSGSSSYHFLPASPDGEYTTEQLRVRSGLKWEVHELTHFTLHGLLDSRRGHLPRWLEEGICEYVSMQFERWREMHWDANREIVARLVWDRPAVRTNLFQWVDGMDQPWRSTREPEWMYDLMYPGSLGLVFALESELGSAGLLDLLKRVLAEGPETDEDTVALLEGGIGNRLADVGRVPAETKERLLSGLLARAAVACGGESDQGDVIPLAALGHFVESADRTIPVLQDLALCPEARIAAQGITGLSFVGRPEPLARTLKLLEESSAPELLSTLEADGSLPTARELARSASRASRWFRSESRSTE